MNKTSSTKPESEARQWAGKTEMTVTGFFSLKKNQSHQRKVAPHEYEDYSLQIHLRVALVSSDAVKHFHHLHEQPQLDRRIVFFLLSQVFSSLLCGRNQFFNLPAKTDGKLKGGLMWPCFTVRSCNVSHLRLERASVRKSKCVCVVMQCVRLRVSL